MNRVRITSTQLDYSKDLRCLSKFSGRYAWRRKGAVWRPPVHVHRMADDPGGRAQPGSRRARHEMRVHYIDTRFGISPQLPRTARLCFQSVGGWRERAEVGKPYGLTLGV